MSGVIAAARKDEVVERAASTLKPREYAVARGIKQLQLNRPASLLRVDHRTGANLRTADKFADLDLHHVISTQLTIDREIEYCAVAQPALAHLTSLQHPLGANLLPRVPRTSTFDARIIL
jgi:hypothetical protein